MEQQILQLHNQGLNYNQIANALGCSRQTVRYHINPKDKADAKTRVELSRAAKKRTKEKEKKEIVLLPKEPKNKVKKVKVIIAIPKKEVKIKPEKVKPPKKEKPVKAPNTNDKKRRTFKNKELNLTEKIPVKLDAKTTVYTLPGYDIDALRKKYLKIKL